MAGAMYSTDLHARLGAALEQDPRHVAGPGDRLAGVLLPLVGDGSVVFTKRTETMSRHAGEISFPGGIRHEEDADILATALRETHEELGIVPGDVQVLGALPPVHTFVSAILIVPFVGVLDGRPVLRPNEAEIARVLEFPLDEISAAETEVEWRRDEGVYRGHAYPMGEHTIWGATAKILQSFLELVRREAA